MYSYYNWFKVFPFRFFVKIYIVYFLLRLTSITEQLKGKSVKLVISQLSGASRFSENDQFIDYQRVTSLLAQWREIDVQITEAANEAKDNVKYLSTLERFFDPLYDRDVNAIIDILPALMNAVKMIHTISRYFGSFLFICFLFVYKYLQC